MALRIGWGVLTLAACILKLERIGWGKYMELSKYNKFHCSNSALIPEEAHEMGKKKIFKPRYLRIYTIFICNEAKFPKI